MKRPCSCSRLSLYSRDGTVATSGHIVECLTDDEIEVAISFLRQELYRRSDGKCGKPIHYVA